MNTADLWVLIFDVDSLSTRIWWLQCIRPSHLIYQSGIVCELSPYFLSRFAKQFGYDQLYVGNPCRDLVHKGSLVNGARAGDILL